ncbi:DivIVA domain-containing protein [Solirubrobacter soli]|uniref:DivIVA domain-containing protein n=1 Tax=Solirubrobacter soli TaxID=363832 RepID=UPI00040D8AF9|nr:DivIVA domain-containing protein [Solirubrobacter soli]
MDRDRIERRDFPTGRRGYDPAAVDEHLRRVADEFEAHVQAPAPSLAASTSEQVRLILEAAERGAADMRAAAGAEASGHVTRVQDAADGMLAKLNALEAELNRLVGALRESGERLVAGLNDLQEQATSLPTAADTPATPAPAADTPAAPADVAPPPADVAPPPADVAPPPADVAPPPADVAPARATPAADTPAAPAGDSPPPADDPPAPAGDASLHDSPPLSAPDAPDWPVPAADTLFPEEPQPEPEDAGARLIALNMALAGSPRKDTRAYLAEHFDLPDLEALLDDVYARAGG